MQFKPRLGGNVLFIYQNNLTFRTQWDNKYAKFNVKNHFIHLMPFLLNYFMSFSRCAFLGHMAWSWLNNFVTLDLTWKISKTCDSNVTFTSMTLDLTWTWACLLEKQN